MGNALDAIAPLADRRPFVTTADHIRLTVMEEINRINALKVNCPPIPKQATVRLKRWCVERAGFAVAEAVAD